MTVVGLQAAAVLSTSPASALFAPTLVADRSNWSPKSEHDGFIRRLGAMPQ